MDERVKDQLQRGREHYAANELDKAEQCLAPLARDGHPFADVYSILGFVYYATGRPKMARQMFEQAVRLNPAYTEAAMHLAVVLNDMGEYEAARDVYRKMMAARKESKVGGLDPFVKAKIANMHAEVGVAYEQSGLYAEAAQQYELALALCPTFVDIRTRLGAAFRASGDLDASLREFERAKKDHPRLPGPRLQLGMTHYAAGRLEEAGKEWREVLNMDPGNKFATMYLTLLAKPAKKPAKK